MRVFMVSESRIPRQQVPSTDCHERLTRWSEFLETNTTALQEMMQQISFNGHHLDPDTDIQMVIDRLCTPLYLPPDDDFCKGFSDKAHNAITVLCGERSGRILTNEQVLLHMNLHYQYELGMSCNSSN